ncbi:MAG: hypothetical protein IPK22_11415 [Verrucomicrobiaceae bacterium]|nr:hypothetical protein [Verrucomicrobiaceae bacterium]
MKITETYTALAACARRRLSGEWECTAAERDLLTLITELSFDLAQTWAAVPCLADFAAVLGLHKSTVCRALRTAREKGFLLVMLRRDETLYSICTETRGNASERPGEASQVKARLLDINRVRAAGSADVDGQQRLPGVLPSEETEAPAKAFAAMMEVPEPSASAPPPAPHPMSGGDDNETDNETDAEFKTRLERMVLTMESKRQDPVSPALEVPRSPRDRSPLEAQTFDDQMKMLCRGLRDEQRHAMNLLREEFASASKLEEAAFFKWGRLWKSRVMKNPLQCLQVAGEHKALRLTTGEGANQPGAWMYRALQSLMTCAAQNVSDQIREE